MVRVKEAREKAGFTQQKLAEASGLSMRAIAKVEAGNDPRISTLAAIARALGITVNDLMTNGKRKRAS